MITARKVVAIGILMGSTGFVYASQWEGGWLEGNKDSAAAYSVETANGEGILLTREKLPVAAAAPAYPLAAASPERLFSTRGKLPVAVAAPAYPLAAASPERLFSTREKLPASVAELPLPAGFKRLPQPEGSFGAWLRTMRLKSDNKVYLYNGALKQNQQAQYAVLDISTGTKDLQQCADAVIRLYAEYLYAGKQWGKIAFHATDGTLMDYNSWMKGDRFVLKQNRLVKVRKAAPCSGDACFSKYLETVFSWAGTLSLSKELLPVKDTRKILPGDVFIKGGAPGHAVIVMDVAENSVGERIFLLAQSYMPAQDIHILKNPVSVAPWYAAAFTGKLLTPEWVFDAGELSRFP